MLSFEKRVALMSLCVILYDSQIVYVIFDSYHDDFRCLEAELQQIFRATWCFRFRNYMDF